MASRGADMMLQLQERLSSYLSKGMGLRIQDICFSVDAPTSYFLF